MIEIKPDANFDKIEEYMNLGNDKILFMSAYDKEELLGAIALSAEGEIVAVKAEDEFLYDGLVKSAINFFDRRNIKKIYCNIEKIKNVLQKIGFKEDDGKMVIDSDEFFGIKC